MASGAVERVRLKPGMGWSLMLGMGQSRFDARNGAKKKELMPGMGRGRINTRYGAAKVLVGKFRNVRAVGSVCSGGRYFVLVFQAIFGGWKKDF